MPDLGVQSRLTLDWTRILAQCWTPALTQDFESQVKRDSKSEGYLIFPSLSFYQDQARLTSLTKLYMSLTHHQKNHILCIARIIYKLFHRPIVGLLKKKEIGYG